MSNAEITIRSVWTPDSTYTHHRIPGIFVSTKGTVIIYNEARRDGSDWAHMDILARRSEDGGRTFSPAQALAYGTPEHPTVNNPVMAEDASGTLHFLFCETYYNFFL